MNSHEWQDNDAYHREDALEERGGSPRPCRFPLPSAERNPGSDQSTDTAFTMSRATPDVLE